MSNIDRYNQVFYKVLNIDQSYDLSTLELSKNSQWDSVSHISLITAFEEEYNIMFDAEDVLELISYNIGKSILQKYGITLDEGR
jgi:acyl carrier protein